MNRRPKGMGIGAVKAAVRKRDGFQCTKCGMTNAQSKERFGRQLDVHRLTPGSLYTLEGCTTVCWDCHKSLAKRTTRQLDLAKGLAVPLDEDIYNRIVRLTEMFCFTPVSEFVALMLRLALPEFEEKARLNISLFKFVPRSYWQDVARREQEEEAAKRRA